MEEVVARLRDDVIADANRLTHPMYMGHQVSAPLPAAVWAECVVAALNQSVAVWEMSPTGTPVEHQVMRWMASLAGFPEGRAGCGPERATPFLQEMFPSEIGAICGITGGW